MLDFFFFLKMAFVNFLLFLRDHFSFNNNNNSLTEESITLF